MAPTEFGWIREWATRSLSPVTVPRGIPLAPEDILQLIKCQCDTEGPCGSMCCGCNKAPLGCTVFCVCQGSIACKNEQTVARNN